METKREGEVKYFTLSDKERRNLTLLELIRKKGPITRTELSKLTGINIVSISNYMKNYADKKLILDRGVDVSTGGRRPELVELNANENFVIGLDLSQPEPVAVLSNLAMEIVGKQKAPRLKLDTKEGVESLLEFIHELIKKHKVDMGLIKALGVGSETVGQTSVDNAITKKFGIDTYTESDAVCAALGEKELNPEADVENLLYMYSELGSGVMMRKDSYIGAGKTFWEMKVYDEQISKKGIDFLSEAKYLKPWSTQLGIAETAKREVSRGVGTGIVNFAKGNVNNVTEEAVIKAALNKDEVALDIIRNTGMNLAVRMAYLINLFTPDVIVLGGGIEKAGELILVPIRKTVKKFLFNELANSIKIISGSLGENAVSLGAASLAIREIFLRS